MCILLTGAEGRIGTTGIGHENPKGCKPVLGLLWYSYSFRIAVVSYPFRMQVNVYSYRFKRF